MESQDKSRILVERELPQWVKRLWQRLLHHFWYVHNGAHLHLTLPPSESYKALEKAAKPSVNRLHLRKLFARGRRYFIMPAENGGFMMRTTQKVQWYPRRRTNAAATLYGTFEKVDDNIVLLTMHSHIRVHYLLDVVLIPAFMTSMIVYMPWGWLLIGLLILVLFGLSWAAHRLNAQLEAQEMIFFIEKALEDYVPEPSALPSGEERNSVIYEDIDLHDSPKRFVDIWEEFYDDVRD